MSLYPCAEYGCRYNGFGLCQFCPDRGEIRAFGACSHFSGRREAGRTELTEGFGFPGSGMGASGLGSRAHGLSGGPGGEYGSHPGPWLVV